MNYKNDYNYPLSIVEESNNCEEINKENISDDNSENIEEYEENDENVLKLQEDFIKEIEFSATIAKAEAAIIVENENDNKQLISADNNLENVNKQLKSTDDIIKFNDNFEENIEFNIKDMKQFWEVATSPIKLSPIPSPPSKSPQSWKSMPNLAKDMATQTILQG